MSTAVFTNLLVPVDLAGKCRPAVESVSGLARPAAAVTLLHVIETIQDVPFEEVESFYRPLQQRAEQVIAGWSKQLAALGFSVRREIIFGRRGMEIVRFAKEQGCDLIVLVSHPYERERPGGGLGTLSHQVALLAPCAVLLLR